MSGRERVESLKSGRATDCRSRGDSSTPAPQRRTIVPTARKIELINRMIDAGIRSIEVTSFVSPRAVPQLADAEEVPAGIKRRADTHLMALVPNERAAERAIRTSVDSGVILCSASNTHNRKNLNRDIDASGL